MPHKENGAGAGQTKHIPTAKEMHSVTKKLIDTVAQTKVLNNTTSSVEPAYKESCEVLSSSDTHEVSSPVCDAVDISSLKTSNF